MKSKIIACWSILFLGIIVTGKARQDTLTVMSYNIYHGENPRESGKNTVQDIADFIADIKPDFVSLQEVDSMTTRLSKLHHGYSFDLADSLAKLTSMTSYFGKAIDFEGGGYGVAILSWKPFESQKIKLPNPKNGEPRVLLFIDARIDAGASLIFAATHLDHQYDNNRQAQAEAINKQFAQLEKPIILAGDFNFVPSTEEYKVMNSQWIGAALQLEKDPEFTYPAGSPTKRLDYIWLSNYGDWEVLEYKVHKVKYSDHLPVVAKVILN